MHNSIRIFLTGLNLSMLVAFNFAFATTVSDDPAVQKMNADQAQKRLKQTKAKKPKRPMTHLEANPNGSGIAVNYRFDTTPQVGKPVTVTLQFEGVVTNDAQVSWTLDAGLNNFKQKNTPGTVYKSALKPNTPNQMQLTITPTVAGWAYLNIFTMQNGMSDAKAIAIKTGQPVMAVNGTVNKTAQGEDVIVMKVK